MRASGRREVEYLTEGPHPDERKDGLFDYQYSGPESWNGSKRHERLPRPG